MILGSTLKKDLITHIYISLTQKRATFSATDIQII